MGVYILKLDKFKRQKVQVQAFALAAEAFCSLHKINFVCLFCVSPKMTFHSHDAVQLIGGHFSYGR